MILISFLNPLCVLDRLSQPKRLGMVYPFYSGLVHVANKFYPKHLKRNYLYLFIRALRFNLFDE